MLRRRRKKERTWVHQKGTGIEGCEIRETPSQISIQYHQIKPSELTI